MKPDDLEIMLNQVISKTTLVFSDLNEQFEEGLAQVSSFLVSYALLSEQVSDDMLPRLLGTAGQVTGYMLLHFPRLGRHPRQAACNSFIELCARLMRRSPVTLVQFFTPCCTRSHLITILVLTFFSI